MGIASSAMNQHLNFFPKPSPKYQDDDMTHANSFKVDAACIIRPSSQVNSSKQSGFENSLISQNKPKFDLSKQINEINKQKLAKEKQ